MGRKVHITQMIYRMILIMLMTMPVFAGAVLTDDEQMRGVTGQTVEFFHSVTIRKGEVIKGSLKVVRGDAVIRGAVEGDITVYFGNVYLEDSCRVTGDVNAIGGRIFLSPAADVGGILKEMGLGYSRKVEVRGKKNFDGDSEFRQYDKNIFIRNSVFPWIQKDQWVFGYNRVDGLIIGLTQFPEYRPADLLTFYGSLAYSFRRDQGLYQAGLERYLFSPQTNRLVLGGEYHFTSATADDWKMDRTFNSLSVLLMRHDYFNYYHKKGFSFYAHFTHEPFYVKIGYQNDRIAPLREKWVWSLFNQNGDYLFPNITVSEPAEWRGFFGKASWRTAGSPANGLQMEYSAEVQFQQSSPSFGGDLDFQRWILKQRWLMQSGNMSLVIRGIVGTSTGNLPEFLHYRIGGMGTLHGVRTNIMSGNRMALANLSLLIPTSSISGLSLDDDLQLLLFYDSGMAWMAGDGDNVLEGFHPIALNRMQNSAGFGIHLGEVGENDGFTFRLGFDLNRGKSRPVMLLATNWYFE